MSLEPNIVPRPMRVGYVVKRYPRYSETFIVNEILAHEAAGSEVEVFSLYPPNDTHFQDAISRVRAPVTYLTIDALKAADLWRLMQELIGTGGGMDWDDLEHARGDEARELYSAMLLARMIRLCGITHLHAHFATSATSVARTAARFARIPYTFTAHAKDIFHESVQPDALRRKLRDAAATVTVSDFNVTHLRHAFGADASRVVRIYNGMDLARLTYGAPVERAPLIVSAGRLVEKKGFNDLVDACAVLARRGVEFSCQIIGTGDMEQYLRAQIARLNLADRVHLLGPRPQREVFELIQRAAAFAAPCVIGADNNMDGLPTVLLESMALGTPCISTDVTGIPEVVINDQTGLLIAQHAPERLADACQRLLDDAALRVRLARRARQLIEDQFDVTRSTARLREVFARAAATIDALDPDAEPLEAA